MTEYASQHTGERVPAEFHAVADRVRALVQRLPGDEFGEDRAYLLAVSAYLAGLAGRAPRGEVGGRLRLLASDGQGHWDVSPVDRRRRDIGSRTDPHVRRMRHNRGLK